MRLGFWVLTLVLALGSIAPAHADREDRREQRRQRMFEQAEPPPFARERERVDREAGPRGRMTPEERQQLRRDIREAGRGIYGERRGRQ